MRSATSFVGRLATGLTLVAFATGARAERTVGGHIGLATPLVQRSVNPDKTTNIGDQFTLVAPIGITVHLTNALAFDFETQVGNPIRPTGTSNFVVAPGLVYNFGLFAAGLRVASAVSAPSNVGLIPLINVGLVKMSGMTWFVEAAFPAFVHARPDPDFTIAAVIHTGIGF